MPAFEQMDRREKAVLWQFIRQDVNGLPLVAPPVEIDVRWLTTRSQPASATSTSVSSSGQILTLSEYPEQSIVRKGRLQDVPAVPDQLHIITGYGDVPDIKARNVNRSCNLAKYTQRLPEIVT